MFPCFLFLSDSVFYLWSNLRIFKLPSPSFLKIINHHYSFKHFGSKCACLVQSFRLVYKNCAQLPYITTHISIKELHLNKGNHQPECMDHYHKLGCILACKCIPSHSQSTGCSVFELHMWARSIRSRSCIPQMRHYIQLKLTVNQNTVVNTHNL